MAEQSNKFVEVITILSLSEYEQKMDGIISQLREADTYIDLSAASVVRTHLRQKFGDWFGNHGTYWDDHFNIGLFGKRDQSLDACCYIVDTDVHCSWRFDQHAKALAAMFKLTWGGL